MESTGWLTWWTKATTVLPRWPLGGAYAPRVVHAVYTPTRRLPAKVRVLIDHLAAAAAAAVRTRAQRGAGP